MPWTVRCVVDERLRLVRRLMEGEKMAPLCAEFGISRKTGYRIYERYKDCGAYGLADRSRRPYRHANRLPAALETLIVRLKRDYPAWGPQDSGPTPDEISLSALPPPARATPV